MKTRPLAVAALLAAIPALPAQTDEHAPPNPKTIAHDALAAFAGDWKCTWQMYETDSDEPTTSTSTERAELICNGLYLKSTIDGTFGGAPFHGVWLIGYDPLEKTYVGLWADNMNGAPTECVGTYEPKSKTWKFSGETPMGEFTSNVVIESDDRSVETCVCEDADGNKSRMVITRERAKLAPVAVEATMKAPKAPIPALAPLYQSLGEWDAVMKMSPAPGAPKMDMPGKESNHLICGGKFVWSDFTMDFMGSPFEGHALCGYDEESEEYVCYWVDTMNPVWSASRGVFDEEKQALVLEGTGRDHAGAETSTHEVTTWKGANKRHMAMTCESDNGEESFEITFERRKADAK